ncbi:efflux RND transporter permease subunit [Inquilinus sp. CAU 1745]|uniref:efflux RND transporter permease subunit n=1 Tax=Inquilinus sp. CAU 1745 TaxID=3140369 RepID=UPI00325C2DF3
MKLSEFCIERPVFSTVMSLLMVLIGVVAFDRLTVREYPNIDEPVVSVTTTYTGASPEIVESQVTQIIEGSVAGIAGIETITSTSRSESSRITINFSLDTDPDVAASDVRDRVGRVRGQLPDEIEEPIIAKVEADAQPVIFMVLTSDRLSPLDLTDYADRTVTDQLQNLNGVAEIQIYGERRYAMRIWIDRARLAAYDLTVQDVEDALRAQNLEVPSGRIESVDREFTVLSRTGLTTAEQFRDIIVKDADGFPVRLDDVARVELGSEEARNTARFNGQNAIAIGVVKQATANPLDVSDAVREALPNILETLPEGMNLEIAYDTAIFIDASIEAVYTTIAEAVVLVVLVIFVFLRTFRATIVPLVTIPVSLIGAFAVMYALGFTINTLTLLSMVLAIGLVVDDAIVVLENIYRKVEEGIPPRRAAVEGIREISGAVVAMTLTLAAVYAPVAFAPGRTGRLFTEFALTLAGTVLISGFIALTLSPMMCSRLLSNKEKHGRLYMMLERFFNGMTQGYGRLLSGALKVRPLVVLVALGVGGASYFLFTNLDSELAPVEDRGVVLSIGVAPVGSTIGYTSRYAQQFEGILSGVPEVDDIFVIAGFPDVTQAISFSSLVPWDERERSQQEVVAEVTPQLYSIPGLLAFAINPPSLGGGASSKPVEFVIQTSGSYEELNGYVQTLMAAARENPGLMNLETDLKLNKPQIEIDLDRERVADVGASVATVGRTLETLLGGRQVTRFEQNGEQYDVIVQVEPSERNTPNDLRDIYVSGSDDTMIQLSNLVDIEETVAPKELPRFNQLRSSTITANLAPGYPLGEALQFMRQTAEDLLPDEGVQFDYDGQSREFFESGSSLYFVFVLALGFIYLVLAAQFESFIDPIIIMVTVPLSMTGALLALYLTGGTLNVFSQIGLVTLIGLITKHGILIVEFANQLQEAGKGKAEAAIEAAKLRLRPILMTTGAMVFGAVPLALAAGAGAESRQQIGWVIVGGMTLGTLLTLFVVPTVYTYLARRHERPAPAMEARPVSVG